ncbi:hypothetical protein RsoM2USA_119 [Ralstonia phage RsoM2USA]|nr:hypothetical protein RsoM2USA_119 [Ralstonia phage RsoM2USA]
MSDTKLTREQANARIEALLDIVREAISEAESLADEHKLTFESPIGTYGMGGTYNGNWQNDTDDWGDPKEDGWYPSSQSC